MNRILLVREVRREAKRKAALSDRLEYLSEGKCGTNIVLLRLKTAEM